jgi:dTDP-4-amino-4,6-dideoxygalactose transaminase
MTTYNFLDVGFTYRSLKPEIDAAYARVMDSGLYIGGQTLTTFEQSFASYCQTEHCVGVGNGLDALVLPLRAQGIGPGDEVIVPANTFIATWLAAARTRATLVPVDADPKTMGLDVQAAIEAITPRTRAILPVHLYGIPVPVQPLMDAVEGRNILVLEDAAQAHGAELGNRRVGTLGHAAGFSFYPGKNLGAFGDAGALVTNSAELADQVRLWGNYGARVKYDHIEQGGNSRLDPLQAAFLSAKLTRLDDWSARRRAVAEIYLEMLQDLPGLTLPSLPPHSLPVWHLFVVRHAQRDVLRDRLAARGVATALHYPIANHHSGAFEADLGHLSLPVTEEICRSCLSLPIGPHLSRADARDIAGILRETVMQL